MRSLRNKFSDLKCLATTENIHVIAITESFIKTNTIDLPSEYNLASYKLFLRDRHQGRGGGIALYVKSCLNPIEITTTADTRVEHMCVQLNTKTAKLYINVIYRRPNQPVEVDIAMYKSLEESIRDRETIILGDFNLPQINWTSITGVDGESYRLIEFVEDNFLHQSVTEPTRETNILDLVLASHEHLVTNTRVGEHLGTSDHNIIRFDINHKTQLLRNKLPTPNFKRADFDGLRNALKSLTPQGSGTEELWENFKLQFMQYQDAFIPLLDRNSLTNTRPEWFSHEIAKAIRERNILYKRKKTNNNLALASLYNSARREVKKIIKKSKKQYEINIAKDSTTDPKKFYRYINNKKNIRSGIGPLVNEDGDPIVESKDIATTLNNFFSSVFTQQNRNPLPEAIIKSSHTLPDLRVTNTDVSIQLDKLKMNKSPGPDRFYPKIIKNVKKEIVNPLVHIYNNSLQSGIVPADWKMADVAPIFKKGNRELPGNYRPISLTSIICKILESIIRDKLVAHLEKYKLIQNTQHGFRKNRSCLTNLLEFYHKLFNYHDNTKAIDVIYLDFQKAFDKVPHDKLMIKVKALGIKGNIGNWIENWLLNRKQRVVVNGETSPWSPVTSGVPQGSVLGPILFIIYINDIDVGLNNIVSKFADDTKIGNAIITEEDRLKLQEDLNKIAEWSKIWQMPFNVNKCQMLQIGYQNKKYKYDMLGKPITVTPCVRDLGITLTTNLKFSQHCNEAAKKANRMLGFISRNFTYKSKDIVLPLYLSLVRPHLEYAVQFWAPHLQKDIRKLESVQRRATKLIPSLRNKPYEDRLRALNLFSLTKRRHRGKLIECFKILKGFNNVDIENYFTLAPQLPTRGNGLKLRGYRSNLDSTKYYFTNDIVDEWNKLPENIIQSKTISTFKTKLDQHLLVSGIM